MAKKRDPLGEQATGLKPKQLEQAYRARLAEDRERSPLSDDAYRLGLLMGDIVNPRLSYHDRQVSMEELLARLPGQTSETLGEKALAARTACIALYGDSHWYTKRDWLIALGWLDENRTGETMPLVLPLREGRERSAAEALALLTSGIAKPIPR